MRRGGCRFLFDRCRRGAVFFTLLALFFLFFPLVGGRAENGIDWKFLEKWIADQQKVGSLRAKFRNIRKLPALRLPQEKEGRLWYRSPSLFRMEVGEPPELLLLGDGKKIWIAHPKRKKIEEVKAGEKGEGSGREYGMAARFPFAKSLEEFREEFEVQSLRVEGGKTEMVLFLRDAAARKAVKEIRIWLDAGSGAIEVFELEFRNGGLLRTEFYEVAVGEKIGLEVFEFDTEGYRVETR